MTQQAGGTHAESPSPRLPAIRTLHNPAWVPPAPAQQTAALDDRGYATSSIYELPRAVVLGNRTSGIWRSRKAVGARA
jgi:hypothetical protein